MNRKSKKAKVKWLEQQCAEIKDLFRTNMLDQTYWTIKSFLKINKTQNICIRNKNGKLDTIELANRWIEYLEELYQENELMV